MLIKLYDFPSPFLLLVKMLDLKGTSLDRTELTQELNPLKTVEMVVDFRRTPPPYTPLTILNNTVSAVDHF
ncbi:hypothetical protein ILYODFUR_015845, partial [Ilyodon furcidens]